VCMSRANFRLLKKHSEEYIGMMSGVQSRLLHLPRVHQSWPNRFISRGFTTPAIRRTGPRGWSRTNWSEIASMLISSLCFYFMF
jgi:hypothetical protein